MSTLAISYLVVFFFGALLIVSSISGYLHNRRLARKVEAQHELLLRAYGLARTMSYPARTERWRRCHGEIALSFMLNGRRYSSTIFVRDLWDALALQRDLHAAVGFAPETCPGELTFVDDEQAISDEPWKETP